MLFNSLPFAAFFALFFVLYFAITANRRFKILLIAAGSIWFYATWSLYFVPVLLGTGLVDFTIAKAIAASRDQQRRRRLLVTSLVLNLGVLGLFKYSDFAIESVREGFALFGIHLEVGTLQLVAPLGISFYTFQSISYVVDVYRGNFVPRKHIDEFIASLTFFPHLIAGPIVRSSFLLPQFENLRMPDRAAVRTAILLLGAGLLKKTIADQLGAVSDGVFGASTQPSLLEAWTGALAFVGQIYGDFAGYTDIAMGLAMLLGFTLPPNFNLPFISASPLEFWQRWHISLSTWIRDYLFLPLMLWNRRLPYLNFVIVMTLAGLWHGPRWTYVLYGAYFGVILAANQLFRDRIPMWWRVVQRRWSVRIPSILLTFYVVVIGQVLFRAEHASDAARILRAMHAPEVSSVFTYDASRCLVLTVLAIVGCHLLDHFVMRLRETPARVGWWLVVTLGFAAGCGIASGTPFVYFQF